MGLGGQCPAPTATHGGDQVPIVQETGWAPAWVQQISTPQEFEP